MIPSTISLCAPCIDEAACPDPLRFLPRWLVSRIGPYMYTYLNRPSRRRGCGTLDVNKYWLNLDPCGLVCSSLVYFIVFFCDYNVVTKVIIPWFGPYTVSAWFHGIFFNILASLALLSHARAMLSNPGAVPTNSRPTSPDGWSRECHRCKNFKPDRAHHCSICGRCVIKMDHHCPWVNNCVGLANHKFFLLFLLYIFSICIYALTLISLRFWTCITAIGTDNRCEGNTGDGLMVLITTILAVLFMLFTCCLGIDQSSVVTTNQTQIDRMKTSKQRGTSGGQYMDERRRIWDNIAEVVGGDPYREGFRITWLLPTPITYLDPEQLTGYCFRDTPRPKTTIEMEQV